MAKIQNGVKPDIFKYAVLGNMAGPIQHFRAAVSEAQRSKVSAALRRVIFTFYAEWRSVHSRCFNCLICPSWLHLEIVALFRRALRIWQSLARCLRIA